jgi:hypothetical protein
MGTVWLIALTCAATELKLDATVRNEERAGLLATGPTTSSVRAADFELNPRLLLRFASPRTLTTFAYGPRLFYRVPDPLAKGPLVLHQADLEMVARLSSISTLSTRAFLYGGEIDYSRALLTFDARTQTPATLPGTGTIRYLNTGAVATLSRTLADTARLSSSLQASTNRPLIRLGAIDYPIQNRAALGGEYVRPLGYRDELQGSLSLAETWYVPGPAYTSLSPLAGWRRSLDRRQELTLHLGALVAGTNGYTAGAGSPTTAPVSGGLRYLPIVDGTYTYQGQPGGRMSVRGEVSVGVNGFFEPVQTVVERRGFVTLRGELTLSSASQLRAVGAVYAPLDRTPSVASNTATYSDPFPTILYGDAAWRQVWSAQVSSEVGVRANSRASRLTAPHVASSQPELIGYVAVIAAAELLE